MTVERPTLSQMQDIVDDLGMDLSPERLEMFRDLMDGAVASYRIVDELPDEKPIVTYPRTPGYQPSAAENPLNAWYVKSTVKGAPTGPLAGKTVALKDNVCLAGVPMMNGAATLEGYVPDQDATIVTRMLDAGATILGKAHCECFCLSGGSHTGALGPVHNPHRRGYSAGGSSSGSGALVASGAVDMAIGGDQGGSIRIPASFCGIYGMKGSWGLVPYTGVMPIESTIDHTGPMTATVADNALLLEVLAGPDGLDPRQMGCKPANYTEALGRGVKGLRIGIVTEGFGWANSQAGVDGKVRKAAKRFESLGAVVEQVSIPMHRIGKDIWSPIGNEGLLAQMMLGNGMGFNWKGQYNVGLMDAHASWRDRANDLSDTLKISMMIGEYFTRHYRGRYYAKAQNIARRLTAAYDTALASYDLLLMPTLPIVASELPDRDADLPTYTARAFEMIANTAPFDVTGHPAMSIPCGLSDGLPVGAMLIAKHWDESTIYAAAAAFEAAGDWKSV
ncbi:amidase [Acidisoma cellulosilytica]|uniref:Amidase n=1 Tax=Acidisoma cellulosilyticum TaxID=2802395 RepID=A0A963Z4G4_9PROT|nr:amidase [Acidisoma cellulosilyticum]MCB8882700.1 amidase [Acidisoma cellulosilyticum]